MAPCAMTLTLTLPDDLPPAVLPQDTPRAFLEAFALEGYRSHRLTAHHVRQLLGHASRQETEQFLSRHEALPGLSAEDVLRDAATAQAARAA